MNNYAYIRNEISRLRQCGRTDAEITRRLISAGTLPDEMTRFLLHSTSRVALMEWIPEHLTRASCVIRNSEYPDVTDTLKRASSQLFCSNALESAYLILDFLRGELRSRELPGRFGEALDVLLAHGLNVVNLQKQPYLSLISAKEIGVVRGIPVDKFWGSMLRLWIEPQVSRSLLYTAGDSKQHNV